MNGHPGGGDKHLEVIYKIRYKVMCKLIYVQRYIYLCTYINLYIYTDTQGEETNTCQRVIQTQQIDKHIVLYKYIYIKVLYKVATDLIWVTSLIVILIIVIVILIIITIIVNCHHYQLGP